MGFTFNIVTFLRAFIMNTAQFVYKLYIKMSFTDKKWQIWRCCEFFRLCPTNLKEAGSVPKKNICESVLEKLNTEDDPVIR